MYVQKKKQALDVNI